MLLNNEWVNNKIKGKIKRFFETNDNKNTKSKNLWNTVKVVLKRKFISIIAYLRKQEKFQRNHLTFHPKELRKITTKKDQSD